MQIAAQGKPRASPTLSLTLSLRLSLTRTLALLGKPLGSPTLSLPLPSPGKTTALQSFADWIESSSLLVTGILTPSASASA